MAYQQFSDYFKNSYWKEKNRLFIVFLLLAVMSFYACKNTNSNKLPAENNLVNAPTVDIVSEQVVDIVGEDSVKLNQNLPSQKKNSSKDNNLKAKVQPKEKGSYESVRDDPDYIGTPCEMMNGECIRHKHRSPELIN